MRGTTSTTTVIGTSTPIDAEAFRTRQRDDKGPGHTMLQLADRLDAIIVQPTATPPSLFDRVAGKIISRPELWATARKVVASGADVVYCTGEDLGIPVALLSAVRKRSMTVGMYVLAPDRPRVKFIGRLAHTLHPHTFAATGTKTKQAALAEWLGSAVGDVVLANEQTDTSFFRPADGEPAQPSSPSDNKMIRITSCGLEQRDYQTLANAVEQLQYDGYSVNTDVCAVSPNFDSGTRIALPDAIPEGMRMQHFEFDELRLLYQQATVTVIPLLFNHYSAGLTAMIESIASGSPVIITRTPGLASEFIDQDLVIGVPAEDVTALANAIKTVAEDADGTQERAARARAWVLEHHASGPYVETIAQAAEGARARSLAQT